MRPNYCNASVQHHEIMECRTNSHNFHRMHSTDWQSMACILQCLHSLHRFHFFIFFFFSRSETSFRASVLITISWLERCIDVFLFVKKKKMPKIKFKIWRKSIYNDIIETPLSNRNEFESKKKKKKPRKKKYDEKK